MAPAPDLLYGAAVIFCGYLVLGITGFGSALVIVPLLAWKWPLQQVVPLALLLDVPGSLLQAYLNRRDVVVGEIARLLPAVIAGSLAGIWLGGTLDPKVPLVALGVYVVAAGLRALWIHDPRSARVREAWRPAAGFSIGLVEVMFGTCGPVVLAWMQRRLEGVHAVRASTPVAILMSATVALAVMGAGGALSDRELWQRWSLFLAVAGLGVFCGNTIARRLPARLLRQMVCVLLVLSGLALAGQAGL